jgi:cullin-4
LNRRDVHAGYRNHLLSAIDHSFGTTAIIAEDFASMQKSGQTSARREDNQDRQKDKKRRHPAEESTTPVLQQQTISELFSIGHQRNSEITKHLDPSEPRNLAKLAETPRSKRQKLRPSSPASEKLSTTSMYSFPSRHKTNADNVIDLTSSPSGSPSPRKLLKPGHLNHNPNLGARKIVVKNLRAVPRADPNQYLDQTWNKLAASLDAIFRDAPVPYSLEELYKGAENVCRQGHSAELCSRLEQKIRVYAESLQKTLLAGIDSENTVVLEEVVNAWSTWNKQIVSIDVDFCDLI